MRTKTSLTRLLVAGLVIGSGVAVGSGLVSANGSARIAEAAVVRPDLYWVRPAGASQVPGPDSRVEVHALDGASTYTSWQMHAPLPGTGASVAQWRFVIGDANADDIPDLYGLNVAANGGRNTNIHVYDGKTRFTTTLVNQQLPDIGGASDARRHTFFAADYDNDGRDDLYAVDASGGGTGVHVFDAGDRFESFLAHRVLPVGGQADLSKWQFAGGDVDGDGRADVYMFNGSNANNTRTSVHVTTAASGYRTASTNRVLPGFVQTTSDRFRFSVADHDGDGKGDVFGIDSQSGTSTAVHVIYAGSGFTTGIHRPTAMAAFNLSLNPTITAWKPTPAKTNPTGIRQKIAKYANDEVGVRAAGCDKYHPQCDGGATPWCAMFATWVWEKAGVAGVPRGEFVARGLGKWGKNRGLFSGTPRVGDWVIWGPPDGAVGGHVDIVVAVHSATEIVVVGGNFSDKVTKRTVNPRSDTTRGHTVSGYVSPPGA